MPWYPHHIEAVRIVGKRNILHLIKHTVRNIEHCAPMLRQGVDLS